MMLVAVERGSPAVVDEGMKREGESGKRQSRKANGAAAEVEAA